ncbi:MAG: hypothetical protein J6E31_01690 [Pyramidobacter sp.]|nr:hypothetical protein [Pyramidobacter sp.]
MWAMMALSLKILMMYICVAIANVAGEAIILPSLTSIAAKYKDAANAAGITGYTVCCAIITAFCVFMTKFATTLPGDLTRFISWNAPGNAGAMAATAAVGQGSQGVTSNMQTSQDKAMTGAQEAQKAQGAGISGVGKMAGSDAGQAALTSMLSAIPGVSKDDASKLAGYGAEGLKGAGEVWGGMAPQAGMAITQGTDVPEQTRQVMSSLFGSAPAAPSAGNDGSGTGVSTATDLGSGGNDASLAGTAQGEAMSVDKTLDAIAQSASNGVATNSVGGGEVKNTR